MRQAIQELQDKHDISALDSVSAIEAARGTFCVGLTVQVIANAGIYSNKGTLADVSIDEFANLFNVNVSRTHYCNAAQSTVTRNHLCCASILMYRKPTSPWW
jgi:NAD(P)-dependent dehydrogenase (short-subunit alcohol dehydrogenase family)